MHILKGYIVRPVQLTFICFVQNESHNMATKSMVPESLLQTPKSFIWLESADGHQEEVEQEVAMLCPFIWRAIYQNGSGTSRKTPVALPSQVTLSVLTPILEYCRFHQQPGRSNKVEDSI